MTWWQGILAYGVSPAIAAIGAVVVARVTGRVTTKAAETTADIERETTAVDGYHKLTDDLRKDLDRLRRDHDALQENHDALKEDHTLLKADHKRLKQESARDKSVIRALVRYVQTLLAEIRRLDGTPPKPPSGLDMDFT